MAYYGGSGYTVPIVDRRRINPNSYDKPKKKEILLTEDMADYSKARAQALGLTWSDYIRSLIEQDRKKAL